MKRLIISILTGISILLPCISQENQKVIELNQTVTGNANYVARDAIYLKPGFSYKAGSNASFRASIDEHLLFSTVYQTKAELCYPYRSLNKNNPVGSTQGMTNISPSGGAIYQIPMEIPSGINALQPNVSVSYNSQTGNSLLGYGWNLSAFSMISRTGKTFYHDRDAAPPKLTTEDNLFLDGQRLLLVSGTNLHFNSKYGTEMENYSEITYKTINGLLCFEVKLKDGLVMEYGSTTDSHIEASGTTTPIFWLLSKVTDMSGNYMTYTYSENNASGEFHLKSIDYTGNTSNGISPVNKIEFFYESRTDIQKTYIAGKPITSDLLLSRIKVSSCGTNIKDYKFTYYYDGLYSKLTEITEFGSDSNEHYNSTLIDWGDYYKPVGGIKNG